MVVILTLKETFMSSIMKDTYTFGLQLFFLFLAHKYGGTAWTVVAFILTTLCILLIMSKRLSTKRFDTSEKAIAYINSRRPT